MTAAAALLAAVAPPPVLADAAAATVLALAAVPPVLAEAAAAAVLAIVAMPPVLADAAAAALLALAALPPVLADAAAAALFAVVAPPPVRTTLSLTLTLTLCRDGYAAYPSRHRQRAVSARQTDRQADILECLTMCLTRGGENAETNLYLMSVLATVLALRSFFNLALPLVPNPDPSPDSNPSTLTLALTLTLPLVLVPGQTLNLASTLAYPSLEPCPGPHPRPQFSPLRTT